MLLMKRKYQNRNVVLHLILMTGILLDPAARVTVNKQCINS